MSAFTCSDFDDDDREPVGIDAESPLHAAEDWVARALARGTEPPLHAFDVLVVDQAERSYVVTVAWVGQPQEWAEYLDAPGIWRACSWRAP